MTGRNDSLREDRDFAGGGRIGCVQIILRSRHCLPIAELWCEVASTGRSIIRAAGPGSSIAKHFFHDGSHISRIV